MRLPGLSPFGSGNLSRVSPSLWVTDSSIGLQSGDPSGSGPLLRSPILRLELSYLNVSN